MKLTGLQKGLTLLDSLGKTQAFVQGSDRVSVLDLAHVPVREKIRRRGNFSLLYLNK